MSDDDRPFEQYILQELEIQLVDLVCLLGAGYLGIINNGLGELLEKSEGFFKQ